MIPNEIELEEYAYPPSMITVRIIGITSVFLFYEINSMIHK